MLGGFEEQPREQCDWNSDWNRAREERGRANGRRPWRPGCVPGTGETAENKTGMPGDFHGHTGQSGDRGEASGYPNIPEPGEAPEGNNQGVRMGPRGCRGDSFRQGSGGSLSTKVREEDLDMLCSD